MKTTLWTGAALAVLLLFTACDSFVDDVEDPVNTAADEQLSDPDQVEFLANGVRTRFATVFGRVAVQAGGLSDELIFDTNVPNATFPQFREIDTGEITLDNNSVDGLYNRLGELRFYADDLVRRVSEDISFDVPEGFEGDAEAEAARLAGIRDEALFVGQLYGGIARYFYATYFGLEPLVGGGVISPLPEDITDLRPEDLGAFIPSDQMYDLAVADLDSALQVVPGEYETRLINSLKARIYLYQDDFAQACTFAQQGLIQGDDPFQALYSAGEPFENQFYFDAGRGRTQFVADFRFAEEYTEANAIVPQGADPAEGARIPLFSLLGNDEETTYYEQDRYPERDSPINFFTWQENELMLAELDLRGTPGCSDGSALARINSVRASHSLPPLAAADLGTIVVERDQELFVTGARLVDQRRFDDAILAWHLPEGTWRYLPITQDERNQNPNL